MIAILPESEGNVLVVRATQKLTKRDYEDVFIPKLDQLIQQHGKIRVVMYLDSSFEGWELGAMWDDATFGLKHRNDFERVAVVGGARWLGWATKLSSHLMEGQLRNYDASSLQEAILCAKQLM